MTTLSFSNERTDSLAFGMAASYAGLVAFIAVANEGSFSRAADRLGIGRSAVSRSVQKLEDQVGARLFLRTTRSTALTGDGEQFFENCRPGVERLLQAMEEMRDLRDGPPRGYLKVSVPPGFGRKVVAPLLTEFRSLYPAVVVELRLDERALDLVAERVDIAFRDGSLDDSQVIAKQLIPMRMVVCASADYAQRNGLPTTIEELVGHACVNQRLTSGRLQPWTFKVDGQERSVTPNSSIVVNDPSLAMLAVLDGQGPAQLPAYQVCDALRDGTLVACMEHIAPDDRGHYLCYLSRRQLPKRVRAFIEFMTSRIRALDLDCGRTAPHTGPSEPVVAASGEAASDGAVVAAWQAG